MLLLQPIVSEKTAKQGSGCYVFRVQKRVNQIEVKKEIERLYRVKVKKVQIINTPSKKRRLGKFVGVRPGIKKAIVVLKEGQKISALS